MPTTLKPDVKFSYQDSFSFPNRTEFKDEVRSLFIAEKKPLSFINYVFCDDKYLYTLNKQFLNHDTFTDVITFDLSEGNMVIGEAYISIPRIRENAKNFNTVFHSELRRVIFHAALHLCGYKDKTRKDSLIIRSKEDYYLHR